MFVSPSVTFGDRAPLLALRATSPVSGESVSQREPLETARPIAAYRVGADARPYRTDCKRTYIKYIRSVTAGSAKPCCFFACFARWLQTACRGIYTVQLPKHPGCLQLVAKFYKQLKITYLCNILNCFASCRVLSTRVRTRWSIAQQCRGPARARTKLRSCLCAPGESCCFPAASRVPRSASSLH